MKRLFIIESEGKRTANVKAITLISLITIMFGFALSKIFGKTENSAIIKHVSRELINDEKFQTSDKINSEEVIANGPIKDAKDVKRKSTKKIKTLPAPELNLRAKQVITRDDLPNLKSSLPTGSNFIGKLITPIDTRDEKQFIKVLLPYGGSRNGSKLLDKDTMLLGSVQYSGTGEKVFINFIKAILPTGQEIEISAQALNPSDYSTGIKGEHHGTAGVRIATTLGLSMVSGMTEVLTEKKALGESGAITPKATMKNAMYHGVSKVADMEASRQAGELAQEKPYVTIEAGIDLIVSLTAPFRGSRE